MNPHLRPSDLPLQTQAAEGLPRRCWSVAEIEEMVRAGIDEDERFELIGGEVVLPATERLTPLLAPELAFSLAELGIGPNADV